jgi:hypothetical protein
MKPPNNQVAGANRRWRWPFRYRGSRHESAAAQLSTLDGKAITTYEHETIHFDLSRTASRRCGAN